MSKKRFMAMFMALLMMFGTFSTALAEAVTTVRDVESFVLLFDGMNVVPGDELELEYALFNNEWENYSGDDYTIDWSLSGAASADTVINGGVLFVGADETADELSITATLYAIVVNDAPPVLPDDPADDDDDTAADDDGTDDGGTDDGAVDDGATDDGATDDGATIDDDDGDVLGVSTEYIATAYATVYVVDEEDEPFFETPAPLNSTTITEAVFNWDVYDGTSFGSNVTRKNA
ncbi:MAG: hypothetical protein LBI27_06330, partial [Clostridiales bacterium]|nr:hypothetical protein [Clostridiales bacterium]